jgi:hypothetical protein
VTPFLLVEIKEPWGFEIVVFNIAQQSADVCTDLGAGVVEVGWRFLPGTDDGYFMRRSSEFSKSH